MKSGKLKAENGKLGGCGGDTDCHVAALLAMIGFLRGAVRVGRGVGDAAPYGCMAKWCHAWEVRIATPACALVCNDTGFCQCRASGRTEASAPTHTL